MRLTTGCFLLLVALQLHERAGVLSGDGIGVYGDSMSMQYSFWLARSSTTAFSTTARSSTGSIYSRRRATTFARKVGFGRNPPVLRCGHIGRQIARP